MSKGGTAEGTTRSDTKARGAGLGGVSKGGAAEGATRSYTEARGAGLGDVVKGGAAEGATRSITDRYKRPVITKEEENPGKKGDTKNKYQTSLCHL